MSQASCHVNIAVLPLGCMRSVQQCSLGKLCPGLLERGVVCSGNAALWMLALW